MHTGLMLLMLATAATSHAEPAPAPPPEATRADAEANGWANIDRELEMTAEGGVDVCEALSLPLSLVPGVGDAVGTVTEWLCILPAALAVDTVAQHFGNRDSATWKAGSALIAQKLFEDALDVPLTVAVVVAGVGVGATVTGTLLANDGSADFSMFVPTLVAVSAGTLLVTPFVMLKRAGSDAVFDVVFDTLAPQKTDPDSSRIAGSSVNPGDPALRRGAGRTYVLMAAAAGSRAKIGWAGAVPVLGPLWKAADEAAITKERMRRVGRDALMDPPGRDLSGMDSAIDVIVAVRGATAAVGQGMALAGLVTGIMGAALPAGGALDRKTGDTVGFAGLGLAVAGLGVYALSSTATTCKTLAVPCFYGGAE